MDKLNWVYLAVAAVVLSTLSSAAVGLMAACAIPVAILWLGRWLADRARSRRLRTALANGPYVEERDTQAIAEVFSTLGYPLRDWVMRGYPTGATQFWVRNAWRVENLGLRLTAMEVQTTPGFMGTGIPVWRVRHCALLVQRQQPWPEFSLWRDPAADQSPAHDATTQRSVPRSAGGLKRLPLHGFMVQAVDPHQAWSLFFPLWATLGQPDDAELFAMAKNQDLVLFWRKRPPDEGQLQQLLDACLALQAWELPQNGAMEGASGIRAIPWRAMA